ncbi:hypothetical protein XELAEV_18003141mg [Xenopus laevis]|nr:hypothetical protein XELAEV_18003141mg [Xenopus laevis]
MGGEMDPESRMQEEDVVSHIIQKGETEREELVEQILDMEKLCNMSDTLCSLLAQESHGAALGGAEGAHNEGGTDGIMAPGLAHIVLGIRTLIYGQEATDLLLDINTAHNRVSVSGDRKSASYSLTELHYPQSPERFQRYAQTLSSRSFPSGRHYWEVEGSESGEWRVGVAYPSIEREGRESGIGYNNKTWVLYINTEIYLVAHGNKWTHLPHVPSCRRIRIWLDYEAGRLSFYELSEPIRHLHTFTVTFTEPLHAAFWVGWGWVRIIRKGAEGLKLERERMRSGELTLDREKMGTESRIQDKLSIPDVMYKGETEKEELVGQILDMEEMCNMCDTLCSLLAQESHGAALCGAEGAHNEGGTDGIMAPGLAHIVLGIRTLIYGQEATDLLLDINTAHNHVSVSGDRKSASYSLTELHYPQSPERFQYWSQALSSRSFPSGRHYWEVEGSESGYWGVGVAYPSIERRGDQSGIGNNNKSWCLYRWYNNNTYSVRHDRKWRELLHVPSCRRIRIWLDYDAGRLSFYELSEPIRHLHTFTVTFTEPLHAAFSLYGDGAWVRIIREREKGDKVLTLERDTDRWMRDRALDSQSRMQEEDVVSHIIHKGETEREELVGQILDMEKLSNMSETLCSLLAQESHGAALCGAKGAHNEGGTDGIMAPGLAHIVLGIRTLIYGQEATDLLLDINTAHNRVSVSGDRKSASYSLTELHYPQSPERFQLYTQTLSSRSFPSGRHYWEVEGSESGRWRVGVAYPSMDKSDQSFPGDYTKIWYLRKGINNKYLVGHNSKWTKLSHIPSCRRIRISLDYEAGRLSFYELSEPIRHLHTFTATFTEPLHAVFRVFGDGAWVKIIS